MLLMHYRFTLPADYDMAVIRRRIAENGHLMDGFPGLGWKAYLHAETAENSPENRYAPFYLWQDDAGLQRFLESAGFAALCRDFSRPVIHTWLPLAVQTAPGFASAAWATIEQENIALTNSMSQLQATETARCAEDCTSGGALLAATGIDPTQWRLVRFRLWPDAPEEKVKEGRWRYRVGRISTAAVHTPK